MRLLWRANFEAIPRRASLNTPRGGARRATLYYAASLGDFASGATASFDGPSARLADDVGLEMRGASRGCHRRKIRNSPTPRPPMADAARHGDAAMPDTEAVGAALAGMRVDESLMESRLAMVQSLVAQPVPEADNHPGLVGDGMYVGNKVRAARRGRPHPPPARSVSPMRRTTPRTSTCSSPSVYAPCSTARPAGSAACQSARTSRIGSSIRSPTWRRTTSPIRSSTGLTARAPATSTRRAHSTTERAAPAARCSSFASPVRTARRRSPWQSSWSSSEYRCSRRARRE